MVCSSASFYGQRSNNFDWSNWSGRVRRRLPSLFVPSPEGVPPTLEYPLPPLEGLRQLVKVAKDATDAGMTLHAIGSGWAFDDQAVGDDWTLDTSRIRSRLLHSVSEPLTPSSSPGAALDTSSALTDEWRQRQNDRASSRKLVHFEAGIKLWQLINALDAIGLALPTMGGANGQALAGVINTSVHGGDWQQPAFPGIVRAVHLVTEGGREVWLEPASAPVTTDDRLRRTLTCPTTEILRSDEVFNAALVGLGRFGIVYSYVLEVRPQFWVAEVATRLEQASAFAALRAGTTNTIAPFERILGLMATDPGPYRISESRSGANPSFFQLVMHTRNPVGIWAQRRWETSNRSDMNLPEQTAVAGDLLACGLNILYGTAEGNTDVDKLAQHVLDEQMKCSNTDGRRGRHFYVTAGPANGNLPSFRGVSLEVMFDANDPAYVDFLESVVSSGGSYRQIGWLSLRPTLSTTATLSMHNVGGPHAVSIEVALLGGLPDNESFLSALQQRAVALGGRLHWGQANNFLTPAIVAAQYGAKLDSWRRSLWRVSGDGKVFGNAFSRQRGLEPVPARTELAAAVPAADRLVIARSGPLQSRHWAPSTGWETPAELPLGFPQEAGQVEILSEGGRSHAYFVAADGAVCFRTRQPNGSWVGTWWYVTTTSLEKPWQGVPGGAVHAVSSAPGSVHVLYANASGNIVGVRGETTAGSAWRERHWILRHRTAPGGHITGVSRSPGQIDIFAVGTDKAVYTASWNAAQGWAGWWRIPGISAPPGAPICAVSRRPDVLDIFVCDELGRVMTSGWAPGIAWKPWSTVLTGSTVPGGWVSGVCRNTDLIDLFLAGHDALVYSAAWNEPHGWGGWWQLNGAKASRPGARIPAVSRSTDLLDIFYPDVAGNVQTLAWAPVHPWGGPWPL